MKKQVGTLLAVTLAAAAPAAASPGHDHATPAKAAVREATPEERKAAYLAWEAEQQRIDAALAKHGIMRPRQLRTGAPACGNVQTKSMQKWQRDCFDAHASEELVKRAMLRKDEA